MATRRRDLLEGGALLLVCLTLAAWLAFPALVRHQARWEPLFFETVPLAAPEPAGGRAYRSPYPEHPGEAIWERNWDVVLEEAEPLQRWNLKGVRDTGEGTFSLRRESVFFAPSDNSDPRRNGRSYSLRRPRDLGETAVSNLVRGLAVATLLTLAFLLQGVARRRGSLRLAAAAAVCLVGFLVTSVLLERTLSWSGRDPLGQRLAQLEGELDRVDVLFLGSSRVYRHLEPRTFDEALGEHGHDVRSFNLSAADMRMPEALFLVRRLLRRNPERLRLLLVDCEPDPLFIREENLRAARIVRWHDAPTFARIVSHIRKTAANGWLELAQIARHGDPFLFHQSHLGRGLEGLAVARSIEPPEVPPENRGFLALDEELRTTQSATARDELERRYALLHGRLGRYRRLVGELETERGQGRLTSPFEIELFTELEALAASHGVRTAYVVDARPIATPNVVWAAERGAIGELLRFDDPVRFPDLYDPRLRFDPHHLNLEGARLYTRLVALEAAELLAAP